MYMRGPGLTLAGAVGGIPPTNEGPSNSTFVPCRNETLFARLPPTIFGLHDRKSDFRTNYLYKNLVCNDFNNWLPGFPPTIFGLHDRKIFYRKLFLKMYVMVSLTGFYRQWTIVKIAQSRTRFGLLGPSKKLLKKVHLNYFRSTPLQGKA